MRSLSITTIVLILSLHLFAVTSNDTVYSKEWDSRTETWVPYDRVISAYNNDLLQSELIQIHDGIEWINYSLLQMVYNNGNVIEELEFYWDDNRSKWLENYRKLFTYDSSGKLAKVLHQNIFKDHYINSSQETFHYNDEGILQEKIIQTFDEAWSNFLRYQYYYNAKDLLLEENLTYWKKDNWDDPTFSIIQRYDENDLLAEKIKIKHNGNKKQNLVREEFVYSPDGLLTDQIVSNWKSSSSGWVNKNRAVYVNDLNGYVCSMMSQSRDRREWVNYLFTEFKNNNVPLSGMEIAGGMAFTIYPINFGKMAKVEFKNPYREEFNVRIINENGDVMASAHTSKDEVVLDARKMIRGIYFIELQGSNLFSGKFSIK